MTLSNELEELVNAALSDGIITDKERETLHRRAVRENVNVDLLDAEIANRLGRQSNSIKSSNIVIRQPKKEKKKTEPAVFDSSAPNTRVVTKGLFIKDILKFNDLMVYYDHRYLQWPIKMFRWVGFVGHQEHTFAFDSDLTYYMNIGKVLGRKTLYLSYSGSYDSLPNDEASLANDDSDDLLFQNLHYGSEDYNDSVENDFNNEDNLDDDLYLKTETIQLRFGKEVLEDILNRARQSDAVAPHIVKIGGSFLNQRLLVYQDEWAFHIMPKLFSDSEIDSTPIKYMAFFLSKQKIASCDIYCGYHRQIDMVSVDNTDANNFHEWCKERAPRLTEKGTMYKSSIWANPFNVWRWLHPDKLSITSQALIYTRKTMRRDEMIYLPFSRVKMFLSGGGIFFKSFEIYGEQEIVPKYSFTRGAVSTIQTVMKQHNIMIAQGKSYHSSFFYPRNWLGAGPKILKIDDRMVFYPRRIESVMAQYNGNITRVASLTLDELEKVTWHKPIFAIFGTLEIDGTTTSIRKDQTGKDVKILIPDLSMFCYSYFFFFTGSLKAYLSGSHAKFERKRKHYLLFK